jgi:hypothetical protein
LFVLLCRDVRKFAISRQSAVGPPPPPPPVSGTSNVSPPDTLQPFVLRRPTPAYLTPTAAPTSQPAAPTLAPIALLIKSHTCNFDEAPPQTLTHFVYLISNIHGQAGGTNLRTPERAQSPLLLSLLLILLAPPMLIHNATERQGETSGHLTPTVNFIHQVFLPCKQNRGGDASQVVKFARKWMFVFVPLSPFLAFANILCKTHWNSIGMEIPPSKMHKRENKYEPHS